MAEQRRHALRRELPDAHPGVQSLRIPRGRPRGLSCGLPAPTHCYPCGVGGDTQGFPHMAGFREGPKWFAPPGSTPAPIHRTLSVTSVGPTPVGSVTLIVRAAFYWGFGSELRLAADPSP